MSGRARRDMAERFDGRVSALLRRTLDAASPQDRVKPSLTLIELFALPGAGKTTVVEAAVQQALIKTRKSLSEEWADASVPQRLAHLARAYAALGRLRIATRFGMEARLATPESVFRLTKLLAKPHWLSSRSGVVLLDQGFLQDLWSILVSGKSPRGNPTLLPPLIRALYEGIDARIVVLDVDPETACARLTGRAHGDSRLDGLPESELRSSLRAASGLQRQIVEAARLAGLSVQTLDGLAPPHVIADQLVSLLSASTHIATRTQLRRISIVGSTGSGKSHLARELASRLGLPAYELDELREKANSHALYGPTFLSRVTELADGDGWIIDGHFRDVRHLIWCRADLVVWLNYPLVVVALQLMRRFTRKVIANLRSTVGQSGKAHRTRRLDVTVPWKRRIGRLTRTVRERREYGRLLRSAEYRNVQVIELTSIRMTDRWLRNL